MNKIPPARRSPQKNPGVCHRMDRWLTTENASANDILAEEVYEQINRLTGGTEFFLRGNVDLSGRNPQGFDND